MDLKKNKILSDEKSLEIFDKREEEMVNGDNTVVCCSYLF
jgi:hypothetical protein